MFDRATHQPTAARTPVSCDSDAVLVGNRAATGPLLGSAALTNAHVLSLPDRAVGATDPQAESSDGSSLALQADFSRIPISGRGAPTDGGLRTGQPLDAGTQSFFNVGFGERLNDVRVHTGADAASSAHALGAMAYTVGRDIVFGGGQFRPDTQQGRWLLAHEMSHVVQHGGNVAEASNKTLAMGDPHDAFEVSAEEAADRILSGEVGVGRSLPRGAPRLRRFTGHFPWAREPRWYTAPNQFEINGRVMGGGGFAYITSTTATLNIMAGTSGKIILLLSGDYAAPAGSGITRSIAMGDFTLHQEFEYRCTPEGVLTIDTAAIVPGSATNDPSHSNPFGIGESEIGMSFVGTSDGSKFVMETVTFTSGGSGTSVSVGPVGVPVGGGTTSTHSVGIRVNLNVIGARPAPPTPTPATTATTEAAAQASATITLPTGVRVAVPPPHPIYFANEAQTTGDAGEVVRWATSLSSDLQAAVRTGRVRVTVLGYASTTGPASRNFNHYSRLRSLWVRNVLAPALGVRPSALNVGWRGSYTAPPADRSRPGGVPSPRERRADIILEEVAPTTSTTVTTSASARAGARVSP
jgi:hypothetical protein